MATSSRRNSRSEQARLDEVEARLDAIESGVSGGVVRVATGSIPDRLNFLEHRVNEVARVAAGHDGTVGYEEFSVLVGRVQALENELRRYRAGGSK